MDTEMGGMPGHTATDVPRKETTDGEAALHPQPLAQTEAAAAHMPAALELSERASSTKYQLSTVICHKGDITGGHYVAYVRNMGAWFRCDDAWVTLVSEEEVAQCQAYMLFFVQSTFC